MRFASLFTLAALGAACASGPPLLLGQPIKKEVAVVVHLSQAAAHGDEFGGTASMVDAVSDGLTERGVRNQVYAADDDHPPAPRIEILVETWGIGHAEPDAASVLGGPLFTPSGSYRIVARFYRDGDTTPSCVREFNGTALTQSYEAGSSTGASVGSSILDQALRANCGPSRDTGQFRAH